MPAALVPGGSVQVEPNDQSVGADGPTVFGIDVSKWHGDIDWDRVAAAGVRFAFIRVSHGLVVLDEKFERNWAGAQRVGVLRGVYQYFEPGEDPTDQAAYVVDQLIEHGRGELAPVIDVESTSGRGAAEVEAAVGEWIDPNCQHAACRLLRPRAGSPIRRTNQQARWFTNQVRWLTDGGALRGRDLGGPHAHCQRRHGRVGRHRPAGAHAT